MTRKNINLWLWAAFCEIGPLLGVFGGGHDLDYRVTCGIWGVWVALYLGQLSEVRRLKETCGVGREPDEVRRENGVETRIWWGRK